MRSLIEETDTWLDTLELKPHELPLAALLRTLALSIEDEPTAAAVSEYRKTVAALTPPKSVQHRSIALADEITGAS